MTIKNIFKKILKEESEPKLVANIISSISNREGDYLYLSSVDNVLNNELKIRNNKKIIPNGTKIPFSLEDKKDIDEYINKIISNLNIKDKTKHEQVLIKIENFKKKLLQISKD